MNIELYNFFFHPLSRQHSDAVKAFSIITNIALTVFSAGVYLAIFGMVRIARPLLKAHVLSTRNQRRPFVTKEVPSPNGGFVGVQALKIKQKGHLDKLKKLANVGQWQHLQSHTSHPDSGFDWWMFPIDRLSAGYGCYYQLNQQSIQQLRQDAEFIENFREGVVLVAKSWGWDLEKGKDVTNDVQYWTGYQVRLGKMLHSLTLFDQQDLKANLVMLMDQKGIRSSLQDWIKNFL